MSLKFMEEEGGSRRATKKWLADGLSEGSVLYCVAFLLFIVVLECCEVNEVFLYFVFIPVYLHRFGDMWFS